MASTIREIFNKIINYGSGNNVIIDDTRLEWFAIGAVADVLELDDPKKSMKKHVREDNSKKYRELRKFIDTSMLEDKFKSDDMFVNEYGVNELILGSHNMLATKLRSNY